MGGERPSHFVRGDTADAAIILRPSGLGKQPFEELATAPWEDHAAAWAVHVWQRLLRPLLDCIRCLFECEGIESQSD